MLLVWLVEPLGWNILSEKNTRKIGLYAQQKHRADTDLQELLFSSNNNNKLGRKLADQSGDDREISFLFQRLSVLIQRYNAILLHDCFVKEEEE